MDRDKLTDLVEKYRLEDIKLRDIDFEEEKDVLDDLEFINKNGRVARLKVGQRHNFYEERKVLNSRGEDYFHKEKAAYGE